MFSKLTPCLCDTGHSGLSCLFLHGEWRIRNKRFGERFLFPLMLLGVFSSADPTGPPPHRPGASRGAGADHAGQRGESGCQPRARSVPTGPLHSDLCPVRWTTGHPQMTQVSSRDRLLPASWGVNPRPCLPSTPSCRGCTMAPSGFLGEHLL